jgi:hypothetical protein
MKPEQGRPSAFNNSCRMGLDLQSPVRFSNSDDLTLFAEDADSEGSLC